MSEIDFFVGGEHMKELLKVKEEEGMYVPTKVPCGHKLFPHSQTEPGENRLQRSYKGTGV